MSQLKAIVDKLLTNVSNGLFQDEGYICESLFPTLDVQQDSGLLAKYGTNHLRIEHTLMAGRGKAKRVESITRSTTSYLLEHHGLEGLVTASDYDNVEAPYDAEKDETLGVTSILLQGKELALANAMTATATMTQNTTLSGTDQWSDYQNSDPLGVAKTAMNQVKAGSGMVPNTVILPWEVMNVVKYHPQILDQLGFKYNQAGLIDQSALAKAFDVQNVVVAKSTYESANEGQTSSLAAIWGKHVIFAWIPPSAKPYQKSLGYYVRKKGVGSRKVYKFPIMNPPNSTGIIVEDYYQYLLSDVLCGYLIRSAVA